MMLVALDHVETRIQFGSSPTRQHKLSVYIYRHRCLRCGELILHYHTWRLEDTDEYFSCCCQHLMPLRVLDKEPPDET